MEICYFAGGARERVLARILDCGHVVSCIYANSPTVFPKVAPTIELAESRNIPVRIIKRKSDLENIISDIAGKFCLSVGFSYILPSKVFNSASLFLNVHGTLLPKFRGMGAAPWLIDVGEKEAGVTVHLIDEGVDTGDIILQKSIAVSPFDTYRSITRKVLEMEPSVVVAAIDIVERDGVATARPQPIQLGPTYPNREPKHSELDPSKSLADLFNKIRSSDPDRFPAYFFHEGQKVCIRMWRPDKPEDESDMI